MHQHHDIVPVTEPSFTCAPHKCGAFLSLIDLHLVSLYTPAPRARGLTDLASMQNPVHAALYIDFPTPWAA